MLFFIAKIAEHLWTTFFLNGGIFDDNGFPINQNFIPKPGLCLLCKYEDILDVEEKLLCDLNRIGQHNQAEFQCGKFEQKLISN